MDTSLRHWRIPAMDIPLPDSYGAGLRWFVVGTIIFALGFEGVVMFWEGKFLFSLGSLALALTLLAVIIYWPVLPASALVGIAIIAASPGIFYITVKICRRLKRRGEILLNAGIIVLFAALVAAIIGGALIYVGAIAKIQEASNLPLQHQIKG